MKLNNMNYQPVQLNKTRNVASKNTKQVSFRGQEEVDYIHGKIFELDGSEKFRNSGLDKFGKVKKFYYDLLEHFSSQSDKYKVEKKPKTEEQRRVIYNAKKGEKSWGEISPHTEIKKEVLIKNKEGELVGSLTYTQEDGAGRRYVIYEDAQVDEVRGLGVKLKAENGLPINSYDTEPVIHSVQVNHNTIANRLSKHFFKQTD